MLPFYLYGYIIFGRNHFFNSDYDFSIKDIYNTDARDSSKILSKSEYKKHNTIKLIPFSKINNSFKIEHAIIITLQYNTTSIVIFLVICFCDRIYKCHHIR